MKDIRAALAEYAAIVEGFAKEYTNSTTVETVRAEHPELDFMGDDEIEELLEHAKNQRNKADYEVIEYEGKEYAWIKQESDAEIYKVNGQYIKVVWGYSKGNDTGWHNEFDTDVCVYRWTGEDCTVDELPGAMDSDWEAVEGFDFEVDDDGEVDGVLLDSMWEAYAKKVDEILAEIEKDI